MLWAQVCTALSVALALAPCRISALPAPDADPAAAIAVDALPATLMVVPGTNILIFGTIPEEKMVTTQGMEVSLRRGARAIVSGDFVSKWRLTLPTTGFSSGGTTVRLVYRRLTGQETIARRFNIEAVLSPPFAVVSPSEGSTVLGTLGLKIDGMRPNCPATCTIDGAPVLTKFDGAGAATVDVSGLEPGSHVLATRITLPDDVLFVAKPIRFNVASAIRVQTDLGDLLGLPSDKPEVVFKTTIDPVIKVKAVTYAVDGEVVLQIASPPFDRAVWKAPATASGAHRVQAMVFDGNGVRYVSRPYDFQVKLLDPGTAQAAQPRQVIVIPPPRPKLLTTDELRKLAASAPSEPWTPRGDVGKAHGLAVVRRTRGEVTEWELGVRLPVSAIVSTAGSPGVRLANLADNSTISVARIAMEFALKRLGKLGFDGEMLGKICASIDCGSDAAPLKGDGAGVAFATVIMSAALTVPIDRGVAMTGAISVTGEVKPVGGLLLKVLEALSDPNIHTVIVPSCRESAAQLTDLFMHSPELLASRRIMAVTSMDQVLRHSLIGFDPKRMESESLLLKALHEFGREADRLALQDLDRAIALTPEDMVLHMWRNAVMGAR